MDLFQKCISIVEKCLGDAGMSKTKIDKIVLAGGSTRIPKLQELLKEFFGGKELCKYINLDEAVAYDAAVQATVLDDDTTTKLILRDVTPLSLGTRKTGDIMDILIPRNTQVPVKKEKSYVTAHDYQEAVQIDVYEGERPNTRLNNLLGKFDLKGIPCAPRGDIKIIMGIEIDADGIVKVSAEHKTSGIKEAMIVTNDSGRLRNDEIAKMIGKAEKLKIKDQGWKETMDLRNRLDQYICDMSKRLDREKLRGEMEKKDAENIQAGLKEAGEWLSENENANKDELVNKLENAERLCRKIDKRPKGLAT